MDYAQTEATKDLARAISKLAENVLILAERVSDVDKRLEHFTESTHTAIAEVKEQIEYGNTLLEPPNDRHIDPTQRVAYPPR